MKAAFYRPDYQKFFMCSLISICFKACGRAFEMLSWKFETVGLVFEGLRENLKVDREFESRIIYVICYTRFSHKQKRSHMYILNKKGQKTDPCNTRSGSRTAATSKMELFVIIVNGFQSLTNIKKCSILDVAAVLDPPLSIYQWRDLCSW